MKAHELARELLAGSDLPVVINGWGSDEGFEFEVAGTHNDNLSFIGEGDDGTTPNESGYALSRPCVVLGTCSRADYNSQQCNTNQ